MRRRSCTLLAIPRTAAARARAITGMLIACTLSGSSAAAQDSTYAYYTEGSCLQAVDRTTATFWRTGPDTTRYSIAHDTLLTVSANVARRCVTKFTVATTQPRDLLLLAQLYLAAGDDSSANAAVARRLASESTAPIGVRAKTIAQIASVYLNAKPHQLARARHYVAELDGMQAPDAAVWQLAIHVLLLRYAYDLALDDAQAIAEANAVITAGQRLTPHDREEFSWALLRGYEILSSFAADSEGAAAAHLVVRRARHDIGKLHDILQRLDGIDSLVSLYGIPAPPLGGVWFGASSETTRPPLGKISLIILTPSREIMPALRRLQHEFGDQLEMTIVAQTVGYFEGQGPMTPSGEMSYLWEHYHTTLHAPGVLVLSETQFTTLPDGRRVGEPTENQLAYKTPFHVGYVLVDRQGIIRTIQTQLNEQRLAAAIQKLM
ncbi:MAG TPA: hypothetical protein VNU46_00915 [Gemmatimonadaceae bacterium]|jgi:hypothetical protein|nr:hypothetical protein [Gemmatimonadaceae bacterium]